MHIYVCIPSADGENGFSYASLEAAGYDLKEMKLKQLVERVLLCRPASICYFSSLTNRLLVFISSQAIVVVYLDLWETI